MKKAYYVVIFMITTAVFFGAFVYCLLSAVNIPTTSVLGVAFMMWLLLTIAKIIN